MAKFLRPRRGSKDNAIAQKILLKKGELFLEFPMSDIGKGPGRLVIGDGATSYQNMNYTSTATNVFRPFITDPELFIPRFDNSSYATSGWTVDAGTEAINAMGDGSSASTVAIPTLIGNIKNALCKHANSIIRINNDVANKADKTIFNATSAGLVPQSGANTDKFLKGDGSWDTPNSSTFTTNENGLVPRPASASTYRYLRADGTWGGLASTSGTPIGLIRLASDIPSIEDPQNYFYDGVGQWRSMPSTEKPGLVHTLPNDASTYNKFLRANGQWYDPQDVMIRSHTYASTTTDSGKTYFTQLGAYNLNKDIVNNLINVNPCSVSIPYTSTGFSSYTIDISKSGYTAKSIAGFNTGNNKIYPVTVNLTTATNPQQVYLAVNNTNESSTGSATAWIDILWVKDSI